MRISEIFFSIQGEGLLLGVPSAFVRTTGCPLRCTWCDTPFTSWEPEGETIPLDEVVSRVASFACRHIVITGGEPLSAPEIEALCLRLRINGHHVTVETAGVVYKPLACDLVSLSPKLGNSTPHDRAAGRFALEHEQRRLRLDVLRSFLESHDCYMKFVLDRPEDVDEVLALLTQLPPMPPDRVLLMPQGVTRDDLARRSPWVAELCKRHGFRFCPRLHIDLYGNRRGT